MTSPRADIELRAGVDPIDGLLDERAHLVALNSELWAQHDSALVWDACRKQMLMQIRHAIRGRYLAAKVAVTEGRIDEEAYCDDDYVIFVAKTLTERAAFYKREKQIDAIQQRIWRGGKLLGYAAWEPKT